MMIYSFTIIFSYFRYLLILGLVACKDMPLSEEPYDVLEKKASISGDNYRKIHRPGANIIGTCKNPQCKAHKKVVVSGLGYGTFDLKKKEHIITHGACPVCNSNIVPQAFSFNDCFFKIIRTKSENGMKSEHPWKNIGPDDIIIPQSVDPNISRSIKIEARKLDDPPPADNDDI